jgi:hypothetical protein
MDRVDGSQPFMVKQTDATFCTNKHDTLGIFQQQSRGDWRIRDGHWLVADVTIHEGMGCEC